MRFSNWLKYGHVSITVKTAELNTNWRLSTVVLRLMVGSYTAKESIRNVRIQKCNDYYEYFTHTNGELVTHQPLLRCDSLVDDLF